MRASGWATRPSVSVRRWRGLLHQDAEGFLGGGTLLCGVHDQGEVGMAGQLECLVGQFELADQRMPVSVAAVLRSLDVVLDPDLADSWLAADSFSIRAWAAGETAGRAASTRRKATTSRARAHQSMYPVLAVGLTETEPEPRRARRMYRSEPWLDHRALPAVRDYSRARSTCIPEWLRCRALAIACRSSASRCEGAYFGPRFASNEQSVRPIE